MKKNKTYVGIMKIHKPLQKVAKEGELKLTTEEYLQKEMNKFVGKIMQKPPVKSRVKREERERGVFSWKILEFDKEKREVLFETDVEAGTYIRKLISDLGERIGGAHMLGLRRTKAGIFYEKDKNFINLYELDKIKDNEEKLKELIIPAEEAIKKIMPVVEVKEESVKKLLTGKPIMKQDLKKEKGVKRGDVAVFSGNKFIEIAKIVKEGSIIAKPEFVKN